MVSFRVPLWIPAAFLAPALLGLLVFRLGPILIALVGGFVALRFLLPR